MNINLLDYRFFRFIFQNPYFVNTLRVFVLFLFACAIFYGFYDQSEANKTTNGILWHLFWPLFMVLSLVTFGRLFCSICPLAFVGKKLNRIGARKTIPPFFKSPFVGIFFLIITFWMAYYVFPGFLKLPMVSATFFSFFTVLALFFFYRYKNMAFCKSVCPVSAVTRSFGKLGFTWMNADQSRCADCKTFECAKACDYHLQPFNFNKNGSMADCTLCMDCTKACDAVKFDIKKPSYAATLNFTPQKFEVWALLLVTAAITVTMNFHHALTRISISDTYPWVRTANWLKGIIPFHAAVDVVGLVAFLYALGVSIALAVGGMWIAAKIMKLSYRQVFNQLGYSFAPIFLVGGLSHLLEFFFYSHASSITNAFIQIFHLDTAYIEPLVACGDVRLRIFGFFNYLAFFWALYILYKRFGYLNAPKIRKWLAAPFAALLIIFYLTLNLYAGYAFKTYSVKASHQHGAAAATQTVPANHTAITDHSGH